MQGVLPPPHYATDDNYFNVSFINVTSRPIIIYVTARFKLITELSFISVNELKLNGFFHLFNSAILLNSYTPLIILRCLD